MTEPDDIAPDKQIEPAHANPLAIIAAMAENPACDPEKLTALVALQERCEDRRAKGEWADAMARLQAACPVIPKRVRGDKAKFAPFEDIMAMVRPLLQEHGLAVSFSSEPASEGALRIVCHITKGTHTESREFTCPIPSMLNREGKAMVNEAQRMGMALSYAKRYCLCAAFNVVTAGEDFDGGPAPNPAAAADPDAPQAASRDLRQRATDEYGRWKTIAGTVNADWWDFVANVLGEAKKAELMTADDWDMVGVVIGEMGEAAK